jgi:hypothetical protein
MARTAGQAFLLLFTLAGCFHSLPDEAVLAQLVPEVGHEPFDKSNQPEYLVFGDELTARVFKSLRQDPRYRILPTDKPFVCPPGVTPCPQPHQLRARVASRMSDSAIAIIERIYRTGEGHATAYEAQYLLIRRNGSWKVEKVLGYSAIPVR